MSSLVLMTTTHRGSEAPAYAEASAGKQIISLGAVAAGKGGCLGVTYSMVYGRR